MIWFTADWHLGHKGIIKSCNRPFSTVEEMDTVILDKFFDTVKPNDTVYFLGDMALRKRITDYVCDLICKEGIDLIIIRGNHDYKFSGIFEKYHFEVKDILALPSKSNMNFFLCHYPMKSWYRSCRGWINLHAHSHGKLEKALNQIDVGVDTHNFYPYSLVEVCNKVLYRKGGRIMNHDDARKDLDNEVEIDSWVVSTLKDFDNRAEIDNLKEKVYQLEKYLEKCLEWMVGTLEGFSINKDAEIYKEVVYPAMQMLAKDKLERKRREGEIHD